MSFKIYGEKFEVILIDEGYDLLLLDRKQLFSIILKESKKKYLK